MVSVIEKRGRPRKRTTPFPNYDVVARTFLQERYNTERWNQMVSEPVRSLRPYWLFDAILDNRTTHTCQVCNGTLLHWDDVWWQTHKPPIHWGCRSCIRCVSRATAQRRGVSVAPVIYAEPGFGLSPKLTPDSIYLDRNRYNSRLLDSFDKKKRRV